MYREKRLRKQVESELKKRNYVFYTLILLSLLYIIGALVFGERGLMRYVELGKKETALQSEINRIKHENERLRAAIESYKDNEFYLEKHARENFGLAGPDEYIYRYEQ